MPDEVAPTDRIAGFWVEVTGGDIRSVLAIPAGWVLNIDNLVGHTTVQATMQEGAAAIEPGFFREFLVIRRDRNPVPMFLLSGELILVGDAYDGRHVPLIHDQFELLPVP